MEEKLQQAIIITGATGSIGKELAKALSGTGRPIILAVRNVAKGEAVAREILRGSKDACVLVHHLDLADTDSVKEFAQGIADKCASVYALLNNAGIMNRFFSTTKQGIEATMGVNLINTAALTHLIAPYIVDGGHVVFTTSITRNLHSADSISVDVDAAHFSQLGTYGKSKAALTHYALYMCNLYPKLKINCADPGVVNSGMITMNRWYDGLANLVFRPLIKSPRQGAKAALRAMTLPSGGHVATSGGASVISYDAYDKAHASLVEAIRAKVFELIMP